MSKLTWIQKSGLIILGIILITAFVNYLMDCAKQLRLKREAEKNVIREGLDIVAEIEGAIIEGEEDVALLEGAIQEGSIITTFLSTIYNMIVMIGIYISVCSMMGELVVGIFQHVICGSTEFSSGFENSMQTLGILLRCSWDKFVKFWNGDCTRYYLTDLIFGLVYGIMVELPCVLIYAITGIDLQPLVDMVYEVVVLPLDGIVHSVSGYHITKWSDSVVKNCYRCTGTYHFNGDNSVTLTKPFNEWAETFKCSGKQMQQGIVKIFQSIIPSPKWGAWIMGQHLDGADNNPSF